MRGIISDPDPSKRCGSFGSGTLIQPYKFDMDTQPNSKSRKIEWSEEWSEEDDPTLSLVLIPIFSPHSVFQRCRNTFRSVSSCSHLPWKPHFTWDLLSKNSEAHTAGGGGDTGGAHPLWQKDTIVSASAVTTTPLSLLLIDRAWISGVNDTAEILAHAKLCRRIRSKLLNAIKKRSESTCINQYLVDLTWPGGSARRTLTSASWLMRSFCWFLSSWLSTFRFS